MSLRVVATLHARSGCADEVEAALRAMLAPTRAEDGCERYTLHRALDGPDRFVMLERWRDDAALARHLATPHMAALRESIAGRVEHLSIVRLERID